MIAAAAFACSFAELHVKRGLDLSGKAQAAHAFGAFLCIRREVWNRAGRRLLQDVGDHAHVTVGDRQAKAIDRVVPAGGVANEHAALGEGLIGPAVIVEIGEERAGGRAFSEGGVLRRAGHPEGFEKTAGAVFAVEAALLFKRIAAIDADLAAALREGEETEIAFGADCLPLGVNPRHVLDEQAGEPVVGLVLVQGNAGRGAYI